MSRPVYSVSLVQVAVDSTDGATILFPSTDTFVIRDIYAQLTIPNDSPATFYVQANGQYVAYWPFPPGFVGQDHEEMRQVFPGPLELSIGIGGAGAGALVNISGYQLTP